MDTLITISQAVNGTTIQENLLLQLVKSGKIRASMLANGELLLNKSDVQSQLPREEQEVYKRHAHLAGKGIGVREAGSLYNIPSPTISRWVSKGYIRVVSREGQRVLLDHADVAYCAEIYKTNPGQGKWIFTRAGTPYQKKS